MIVDLKDDVCILLNKRQIYLSSLQESQTDQIFLCQAGLFMLHQKYHTFNMIKFAEDVDGFEIAEKLKIKNANLPLYPAFIAITLSTTMKS